MCELLFSALPNVTVKTTEKELAEQASIGHRVGTYDLVQHLQQTYPNRSFHLLLGADTYNDLQAGKWKNGSELQEKVPLVVLYRKGVTIGVEDHPNTTVVDIPALGQVSSTAARSTTDRTALASLLEPQIIDYIQHNELYAFAPPLAEQGEPMKSIGDCADGV